MNRTIKIVAAIAASFIALAGVIVLLLVTGTVTLQMGLLMFAALLGLYAGFGLLAAVYRLVRNLE